MHIHSKFSHFFLSVRQPYKPNVQSPFGFALTLLRGFSDDIVPSELSTQPWNMTSSLSLLLSVTPLSPHRLKLCHSDFLSVSYLQIYYDFFLCVLHWPPRISYRAPNNGRRSPWRDCAQLSIPQPHVRDCRYRRRRRRGAIETEVRQKGTDGHSLQSARGAVKFCFPVKYVPPPPPYHGELYWNWNSLTTSVTRAAFIWIQLGIQPDFIKALRPQLLFQVEFLQPLLLWTEDEHKGESHSEMPRLQTAAY